MQGMPLGKQCRTCWMRVNYLAESENCESKFEMISQFPYDKMVIWKHWKKMLMSSKQGWRVVDWLAKRLAWSSNLAVA